MSEESAVVAAGGDDLVMVQSPKEAMRRLDELKAFVKAVMVVDEDYGIIPGMKKPTLFQPGAQKLCEIYGLAADIQDAEVVQDWKEGFFLYRKVCRLTLRRNGLFVGSGIGSCHSLEPNYRFKRDGSARDPYELVNTLEKMAAKRSLIHAVLGVTRSSGLFTQDVEDLPGAREVSGGRTPGSMAGDETDPVVVKDPPRWKGESCIGKRYSELPIDYLDEILAFKAWQLSTPSGKKNASYIDKDIAIAKAWREKRLKPTAQEMGDEVSF